MNVALISPYPNIYSFGIRTLSSCLKKAGHSVTVIFLPRQFTHRYDPETMDDLAGLLKNTHLAGISVMTNFFDNAVQITGRIKQYLEIPVIWGGIHPTIRSRECLEYADMACIGEGEKTIVELAERLEQGHNYKNIDGLCLKDNGSIVLNRPRPLTQDLDSIPFQDYEYKTHYVLDGKRIQKMSDDLFIKHIRGKYLTMATRGCPFTCSYCCNNTMRRLYPDQQLIRKRGVDNVIGELAGIKNKLPFEPHVYFDDDCFFLYSTDEIKKFCKRYKEQIDLPMIITGTTPTTLTREKFSLLVDAGLKTIRMGIQTGSDRTRILYRRSSSNQDVLKATGILNGFKDKIHPPQYDIILDNPWEGEDDLADTLMFLAKVPRPYGLTLFSLTFYPETELYEKAMREGIIKDDTRDVYRKSYHSCKKTYFNRLFSLMSEPRAKISAGMMSLLTNKNLRKLKLHWLLYGIAAGIVAMQRYQYLAGEGLRDLQKWNLSRIIRRIIGKKVT